jgi:8-oxo-dGTP pyrophosphatase MutT (NUDIX family)
MCRLESWQASDTELELQLSSTSYKVFLGTNMSHPEFADIYGPAVMANPVGLSAPVITVDQQLLLGFRNNSVAYYPHRVHPFAGSLEPTDFDVFSAITRELREELSLSAAEIVEMRCTGITEDASLRQPELIFAAELALTESEIDSRLDRQEHSSLWRIPATAGGVHAAIASDTRLTPVGLASLLLWGKFRYGSRWYQEAKSAIAMA